MFVAARLMKIRLSRNSICITANCTYVLKVRSFYCGLVFRLYDHFQWTNAGVGSSEWEVVPVEEDGREIEDRSIS